MTERDLLLKRREALLLELGAIEEYLGMERSVLPKRRREVGSIAGLRVFTDDSLPEGSFQFEKPSPAPEVAGFVKGNLKRVGFDLT